jgi:hypothetical protein
MKKKRSTARPLSQKEKQVLAHNQKKGSAPVKLKASTGNTTSLGNRSDIET